MRQDPDKTIGGCTGRNSSELEHRDASRGARFPAVKTLDAFDFMAIPSVNKALVMELARCECIQHRENVIAVGNSGSGKTHVALGLVLPAGIVRGIHRRPRPRADGGQGREASAQPTAAAVPTEPAHRRRAGLRPPVPHRAELLFEVFSQRCERGSILVTANLPFDEWTQVFGSDRLPPRPHPGDERRQLPPPAQQRGNCLPNSR